MKTLLSLLLICGALTWSAESAPPARAKPFDPFAPMPAEQIARAKARMPLLRADMPNEQVFATLGLSDQLDCATGIGGGPMRRYHWDYSSPGGLSLEIVRDYTIDRRKNGLLSVQFEGAKWKRDEKK